MSQPNARRVVALGFFDGVHLGHGALLRAARAEADRRGCLASVLSFDAYPGSVIRGQDAPLLSTVSDRERLMRRFYQMDEVRFLHFDRELMRLPWEAFLDEYVIRGLNAEFVVCGDDYRFGYRGEGTPEKLRDACAGHGIGCRIIPQVELDGERISSTRIRSLLLQGDMEQARRLLGHPQLLSGQVIRGRQVGRSIGVPTANIPFPEQVLVPPFGVYCARAEYRGVLYPAVVNIGVHPTAEALDKPVLEAWIYGLDEDLYGKSLSVWLYKQLRREQKFPSLEALKAQITLDAQQTRAYFE